MTPTAFALALCLTVFLAGSPTKQQTGYKIPEAHLVLDLPNQNWHLADHSGTDMVQYIFKRDPVKDGSGREIIPAIMVFVEDASNYKGDIVTYSVVKRAPLTEHGVKIDSTHFPPDKGYPVSYKNSLLMECHYSDAGGAHRLYMIHILTKENKGIMVLLDMTQSVEKECGAEFWKTIRSIHESST